MFVSILREKGSWSLYHRPVQEKDGLLVMACGWSYGASLKRIVGKPELDMLICANCNNNASANQDVIRLGGHLTPDAVDLANRLAKFIESDDPPSH